MSKVLVGVSFSSWQYCDAGRALFGVGAVLLTMFNRLSRPAMLSDRAMMIE